VVDWEEEIFDVGSSEEENHGWGGPIVMGPNWLGGDLVFSHGIQNRLPVVEDSLYASSPEL